MKSLRALREQQFLSQTELSRKAGLAWRTIDRLESYVSIPQRGTVRKLADALGVEPSIISFKPVESELALSDTDLIQNLKTEQYSDPVYLRGRLEVMEADIRRLKMLVETSRDVGSMYFDIFVVLAAYLDQASDSRVVSGELLKIMNHWEPKIRDINALELNEPIGERFKFFYNNITSGEET
jgi:transcriptional regulator with XRE-family HTH domain